jgi:signal transduction histidine kinase
MSKERRVIRGRRELEQYQTLAAVGHELRTPLTSIRAYIETLLDDEALDRPTGRRFLETARREARRLGRMIDGMVEVSMLDLSTSDLDAQCDLAVETFAAVEALLPLAHRRGLTITVDVSRAAPVLVETDLCAHVLFNLIDNAVKYGREGGTVAISCERDDRFACLIVDDDGPGIVPAERDSLFRMGVRGRPGACPGSGIGLAVVKAIAERAGGDVSIAESPLGGARFVLRLKLA